MKQTAAEWVRDRRHAEQFPGSRGTFGGNRIPRSYLDRFTINAPNHEGDLPRDLEHFIKEEL